MSQVSSGSKGTQCCKPISLVSPLGLADKSPELRVRASYSSQGQNLDVALGSSVGTLGSQFLQLVKGLVNIIGIQILIQEPCSSAVPGGSWKRGVACRVVYGEEGFGARVHGSVDSTSQRLKNTQSAVFTCISSSLSSKVLPC